MTNSFDIGAFSVALRRVVKQFIGISCIKVIMSGGEADNSDDEEDGGEFMVVEAPMVIGVRNLHPISYLVPKRCIVHSVSIAVTGPLPVGGRLNVRVCL